jgi:hypothetical protein
MLKEIFGTGKLKIAEEVKELNVETLPEGGLKETFKTFEVTDPSFLSYKSAYLTQILTHTDKYKKLLY